MTSRLSFGTGTAMTRPVVLAVVAAVLAGPAEAQVSPVLSHSRLVARFQAALDSLQAKEGFPGATAAFVLRDGRSGAVATGLADVEAGIKMKPASRMLGASTGKTYVAAVALALAKEGRLGLGDPIAKWLGQEDWFPRLTNGSRITVRQLLTHSSGVTDHVYDPRYPTMREERRRADPDWYARPRDALEYVLDKPALFDPGRGFSYTDSGYLLAGLIIERACACRFYDEAARRFLKPLGLTLTGPSDRRDLPGLVPGYLDPDNHFHLPTKTLDGGRLVWNPRSEWTGGGMATNSLDLARWARALYEGKAMPFPYVADLLANAVLDTTDARRYGLAVSIRLTDLGPKLGHGGWIPGYRTDMGYYPDWGFSVAIQMNTDRQPMRDRIGDYAAALARVVQETITGPRKS